MTVPTSSSSSPLRPALFAGGLIAYAFGLQFSTATLGSIDGFFHIRYAAILHDLGLSSFPPEFPWLPLTIRSADRYYDHHMLFHLLLAPFAAGDLVLRAKLVAATGAGLTFVATYCFLLWQQVRRAEGWMLAALAVAPGFLYRMEMPRVQAWSFLVLLLAVVLLLKDRPRLLFPLAWFYTWLYDAFPLLMGICAASALAAALFTRRARPERLLYPAGGILAGTVSNPYFPHNVSFILHHYAAKLAPAAEVDVGSEWQPVLLAQWVGWPGLAVLLAAVTALAWRRRDLLDETRATLLLVAGLFLALLWRSVRFVEYLAPFGALAVALFLHAPIDSFLNDSRRRRAAAAALLCCLAGSSAYAIRQLRQRPPAEQYAGAAQWIRTHIPPGALVFNADWDAFPLLFFHDPEHAYVIGLDPTYLSERDYELWSLWNRMGRGEIDRPAAVLRDRFGAGVAIGNRNREDFVRAMQRDPDIRMVFEDADAIVFTVNSKDPTPTDGI